MDSLHFLTSLETTADSTKMELSIYHDLSNGPVCLKPLKGDTENKQLEVSPLILTKTEFTSSLSQTNLE